MNDFYLSGFVPIRLADDWIDIEPEIPCYLSESGFIEIFSIE